MTFEVTEPGVHHFAIAARGVERPLIDQVVLIGPNAPPTRRLLEGAGPRSTHRNYLAGQPILDPRHPAWLARAIDRNSDGKPDSFLPAGLGSPEGLLFLAEEQRSAIVDNLLRHGGNIVYAIAVRSHGGDGAAAENPFLGADPRRGLDAARLDDWEVFFRRLARSGVVVHLMVYDDSAAPFGGLGKEDVQPGEAEFFAALGKRFAHLPNLMWCVAEEYHEALPARRATELARLLGQALPHQQLVGAHHRTGDNTFDFPGTPAIQVFAHQPSGDSPRALHEDCLEAATDAAGRWPVLMSENWNQGRGDHAAAVASGDRAGVRRRNWAAVFGGAAGVQLLGPWERISRGQPATPEMLGDLGRMARFFEALPLWSLAPAQELARSPDTWVLADTSRGLVVATGLGGPAFAGLPAGDYQVTWFNPETEDSTSVDVVRSEPAAWNLVPPPGWPVDAVVTLRRVEPGHSP